MSLQEVAEAHSVIVRDLSLSLTLHNAHSGDTQRSRAALNGVRQPLDNIRFAFDRWVCQEVWGRMKSSSSPHPPST
jgi:hypothetical protein